ncbi:MAG: DUF2142 domain-containing protein, partial [Anaerolineae bacterium]|nr:DUF2142 domain-containing protein [Anaerolineae bacterium]
MERIRRTTQALSLHVSRRGGLLIILAYVALAVGYALATPMYEAPDESYHFAFAQRLAQSWELPVQDPERVTPWYQEGSQPPLYYYLASLLVRLTGAPTEPFVLPTNPHAAVGIGVTSLNNNFYLHSPADAFPGEGAVRAFYLVRGLSITLGAVTLAAIYRTARLALSGGRGAHVALLALAVVAFNPMFLFIHASVNNDTLVTALSALGLTLIVRIQRDGLRGPLVAALAVVMALAGLSKLSGLLLYAPAFALLAMLVLKRRATLRRAALAGLGFLAALALIAGWWYVRNLQLYGDLTGASAMIAIILPRPTPYTLWTFLGEMEGLRVSFWALFGWFNVIGPGWFLLLMDVFTALALVGGILWAARQIRGREWERLQPVGLLGLHGVAVFVALIYWTRQTPGTQGRLLFPALAGIATLAALGWSELAARLAGRRRVLSRALAAAPVSVMAVVAALSPALTILPAYAPPPVVAGLPDDATPVDARFDRITLLGYRIAPEPVAPGGGLPITLYLTGEPDPRNLSLYLTALGPDGPDSAPIGKVDSYPGGGNLPTAQLQPGLIYADTYWMPIEARARGPVQFRIEAGFWEFEGERRIPATGADGAPLESVILRGGVLLDDGPAPMPEVRQPVVFSGVLRLNGYTLRRDDERAETTLVWEGLGRVYEDFNVMVHLVAADGTIAAQGDSAPRDGLYPTSAWVPNRPFEDDHALDLRGLPPGEYTIRVGLYRLADLSRLPA